MADATTADTGCGCCRPEPKTTQDLISELQARREDLDERLRRLEMGRLELGRLETGRCDRDLVAAR